FRFSRILKLRRLAKGRRYDGVIMRCLAPRVNNVCARRVEDSEVQARRTLCWRWRRLVDFHRHSLINADMFRRLGVRAGICRANLEAGLAGFAGVDIVWACWDVGVAVPAQFI